MPAETALGLMPKGQQQVCQLLDCQKMYGSRGCSIGVMSLGSTASG